MLTRIVLSSFAGLLLGCSPSGRQVAGRYVAPHAHGTDYVEMYADHTYVHTSTAQAATRQQSGTWYFEWQAGQQKIVLQAWVAYTDPLEDVNKDYLGQMGSFSAYWTQEELLLYPDFEEYNYYRQ